MIPYSEQMVEGKAVNTPWSIEVANRKLESLQAEVLEDFRVQMVTKARALGLDDWIDTNKDGKEFVRVARLVKDARDRDKMEISAVAQEIQFDAAQMIDELRARWLPFCSKPQDPATVKMPSVYSKKSGRPPFETKSPIQEKPITDDKPVSSRKSDKM